MIFIFNFLNFQISFKLFALSFRLKTLLLKNYTKRVFFWGHPETILQQMGIPKPMRVAKSRKNKKFYMKAKWNGELLQGMQELPEEACASIAAGESLWFWIGYGIGAATDAVKKLIAAAPSGHELTTTVLV
jgi:hypothetical protein